VSERPPVLAAHRAGRRFGARVALEPTDLEIGDGEALALVGPNGAGKSTLLSLLAGALAPSEGSIERRLGAKVGWAPQRAALYGRLSARENLELFARLDAEPEPERIADALLADFELPDGKEPSGNLSVGNRQRLNVAIALIGEPDALLLDEPTAALDPEQRQRLWERAASLRERGVAVVFATQNLEEVEREATRVAVLRDGALAFAGPTDDYDGVRSAVLRA
jgi:ABC-2 type transport system ATP-binding protein